MSYFRLKIFYLEIKNLLKQLIQCPKTMLLFHYIIRFELVFDFTEDDLSKLLGYEMQLISLKNYVKGVAHDEKSKSLFKLSTDTLW